jgi:hypothetical protein
MGHLMNKFFIAGLLASISAAALAQDAGPYHVIATQKVGGDGGFDYLYADSAARRLFIARGGAAPVARITVYDLDTLQPAGVIPGPSAHIVQIDPKSGHGFTSSKPVVMFDAKTLAPIKNIDVQGNPDGMLYDPFNERIYAQSHNAPNSTVIDAASGTVLGTIDLGGAPEQAVTDGQGHIYIDIEDKDVVAVVDAKTMAVTARYDLGGKGGGPGALAIDTKNHILFVACHNPATMVMLDAQTGKILASLPIGMGVDEAAFDPGTMEAFSSQGGDGTMTIIKEISPTNFQVEQTVKTAPGARTMALDSKTHHAFTVAAEFGPPPPGARRGPMVPGSFTIIEVGK